MRNTKKSFSALILFSLLMLLALPRKLRTWVLESYEVDIDKFWYLDVLDGKKDGVFQRPFVGNSDAHVDIYLFEDGVNRTHPAMFGLDGESVVSENRMFYADYLMYGHDLSDAPIKDHGTSVAGAAAGYIQDAPIGVTGGVNNLNIIPMQVDTKDSFISALRASIDECLLKRKKHANTHCILNISHGYKKALPGMTKLKELDEDITKEIIRASKNGIAVVIAAGNLDTDCTGFPQSIGNIYKADENSGPLFIVGSFNKNGTVTANFNTDACVNIYAPGEEIFVATNNGQVFEINSGTSFGAPIVSGILAILYKKCPNLNTLNKQLNLMQHPVGDQDYPNSKQLIFSEYSVCAGNNFSPAAILQKPIFKAKFYPQ